jgi:hypothetical protein
VFLRRFGSDSPWYPVFTSRLERLNKDRPREPFSPWKQFKHVDAEFKDLIGGLTDFDIWEEIDGRGSIATSLVQRCRVKEYN